MYKLLNKALTKPELYAKSEAEFWNDEYISSQMLKAHLNPNIEAASRKLDYIEKSVEWISKEVPASKYSNLLDIGCGPGLYTERFFKNGYNVTGMDFSIRSIEYARESARQKGLSIEYVYGNYLELDLPNKYDICTLIYCDYGALSTVDRRTVMKNVYNQLADGGKFLLDVFTQKKLQKLKDNQTWGSCKENGFWREGKCIVLEGNYKYSDSVSLCLTTIIEENKITPYYLWDTYFTSEMLKQEAIQAGFKVCGIFGDVKGTEYTEDSETMAILLEK